MAYMGGGGHRGAVRAGDYVDAFCVHEPEVGASWQIPTKSKTATASLPLVALMIFCVASALLAFRRRSAFSSLTIYAAVSSAPSLMSIKTALAACIDLTYCAPNMSSPLSSTTAT